jgi:hypothetical protein
VRQVDYLQEQISVSSRPIEGTWRNKAAHIMFFKPCLVIYIYMCVCVCVCVCVYNKNQQNAHFLH